MLILDDSRLAAALESSYRAFGRADLELAWGPRETALGAPEADQKRYFEFDDRGGDHAPEALIALRSILWEIVQRHSDRIERAWGPLTGTIGELADSCNGPLLRMSGYPAEQNGAVNHPHCDINLFTALPAATSPGLEIEIGGVWQSIEPAPDQLLLLPGELIGLFGGPPPACHRVMSNGAPRMSASLFVNADPLLRVGARTIGAMIDERLAQIQR